MHKVSESNCVIQPSMIAIIGIGAIGSWLSLYLARPEWELLLWDDDRVEQENIGTSAFLEHHVGAYKAIIASELAAGKGCFASYNTKTLTAYHVPSYLDDCDLIIDCLDNAPSRRLLHGLDVPTVHIGVSDAGSGSIIWDEDYQIPEDGYERGQNPVCTRDLSRAVLRMVATAAASVVEDFTDSGAKRTQLVTSRRAL